MNFTYIFKSEISTVFWNWLDELVYLWLSFQFLNIFSFLLRQIAYTQVFVLFSFPSEIRYWLGALCCNCHVGLIWASSVTVVSASNSNDVLDFSEHSFILVDIGTGAILHLSRKLALLFRFGYTHFNNYINYIKRNSIRKIYNITRIVDMTWNFNLLNLNLLI